MDLDKPVTDFDAAVVAARVDEEGPGVDVVAGKFGKFSHLETEHTVAFDLVVAAPIIDGYVNAGMTHPEMLLEALIRVVPGKKRSPRRRVQKRAFLL
jgi:hypothetical protein